MVTRTQLFGIAVGLGLAFALGGSPSSSKAEVQLACGGTLLQARGNASLKRTSERLRFSLTVRAEDRDQAQALQQLQGRLGAVRQGLQGLAVEQLEVSSPSSWNGSGRIQASVQLSGVVAPERLNGLVQLGSLAGVQLQPVQAQAAAAGDAAARKQLLKQAYREALIQGQELAAALGLSRLRPLEVQLEGGPQPRPMALRALAADPGFDPSELPPPTDQLSLRVSFCAR